MERLRIEKHAAEGPPIQTASLASFGPWYCHALTAIMRGHMIQSMPITTSA